MQDGCQAASVFQQLGGVIREIVVEAILLHLLFKLLAVLIPEVRGRLREAQYLAVRQGGGAHMFADASIEGLLARQIR